MDKEPTYLPKEEEIAEKISERLILWSSILDESQVSQETKNKIRESLMDFQEDALKHPKNIEHYSSYAIAEISIEAKSDKNEKEGSALYNILARDMDALVLELKS